VKNVFFILFLRIWKHLAMLSGKYRNVTDNNSVMSQTFTPKRSLYSSVSWMLPVMHFGRSEITDCSNTRYTVM